MPRFVHHSYYCTNVARCEFARRDHAYGETAAAKSGRRCCGTADNGCGGPLVLGARVDKRPRMAALAVGVLAALGVSGFAVYRVLVPEPVVGIEFAPAPTRVTDDLVTARIMVHRTALVSQPASIRFRTEDGSALAGHDFVAAAGELKFLAGERDKALQISLLPGGDDRTRTRSFSVSLLGVEGSPRHVVTIEPFVPDANTLSQADALVRSASGLSIDIAGLFVRRRTIHRIVDSTHVDAALRSQYASTLGTLDQDMANAQARYRQVLKDLSTVDRRAVDRAFDIWLAKLEQEALQQQAAATRIARQQYAATLAGNPPPPEVLALQLSEAIPLVGQKAQATAAPL